MQTFYYFFRYECIGLKKNYTNNTEKSQMIASHKNLYRIRIKQQLRVSYCPPLYVSYIVPIGQSQIIFYCIFYSVR